MKLRSAPYKFLLSGILSVSAAQADHLSDQNVSSISEVYELNLYTATHVAEFLPTLKMLAQDCKSIVEIGASGLQATWGLLEGLKESRQTQKSFLAIDQYAPKEFKIHEIKKAAHKEGIDFKYWSVNDLYIQLEPVDMLYLDSIHTYRHLTTELASYESQVKKYIVIHNTGQIWGHRDDPRFIDDYNENLLSLGKRGQVQAVIDFLSKNPQWQVYSHHEKGTGLTILKRVSPFIEKHTPYHPDVDKALENKMILCTGPSWNRFDQLKQVTESDMRLIPFKKVFVATNDPRIQNIEFFRQKPHLDMIPNKGHQIDCLNCIISSLKSACLDPEVLDDDIILFKHESVFINDLYLVKKSISKILEGYDMVDRVMSHLGFAKATDAFFVKVSAIRDKFKTLDLIENYPYHAPYCEQYFSQYLINHIQKIYEIPSYHLCCGWVELGFYHYHSNDWKGFRAWDRSNYHELFKK